MGNIIKVILVVLSFIRTWCRGKAKPVEIRKLKEKVDNITNEQAKILDNKPFDYGRYHKLDAELVRLNKKISRLQTK